MIFHAKTLLVWQMLYFNPPPISHTLISPTSRLSEALQTHCFQLLWSVSDPFGPTSPLAPRGPGLPATPFSPLVPSRPFRPGTPLYPLWPGRPGGPCRHVLRFCDIKGYRSLDSSWNRKFWSSHSVFVIINSTIFFLNVLWLGLCTQGIFESWTKKFKMNLSSRHKHFLTLLKQENLNRWLRRSEIISNEMNIAASALERGKFEVLWYDVMLWKQCKRDLLGETRRVFSW